MNDGAALQGFQLHERRDGERRARQHRQCRPGRGVDGGQNAVDADGRLYLHSAGGGNRRLFFSGSCRRTTTQALSAGRAQYRGSTLPRHGTHDRAVHQRLAHGYCSRTTGKPIWLRTPGKYSITSTGWWILPPVAEQIVLVCPTFVMTAMRVVYTFSDGANTPYSGWVPLMFGAADGFDAETELNMVLWSAWSANSAMGLMLSAVRGPAGRQQTVYFLQQQLRQRGGTRSGRGPMRNSRGT